MDEVDSILIDEARTPLIISGPSVVASDSNEYDKYKPDVESPVRTQQRLCDRFLSEAEELMKKLNPQDGSNPSNPDMIERRLSAALSINRATRARKLWLGCWKIRKISGS